MSPVSLWSAQISTQDSNRTVSLSGELDLTGADELRQLLINALETSGAAAVTADLANVTFLDSAALGALISAHNHADDTGQQFYARNPTQAVQRVLDTTGVNDILNPPT